MLYLFGGGYMLGSPRSRRKTAGHLALAADAEVFVPDYRLAPEHPFPAAFDDAVDAYNALPRGRPVFVAGDSSGGGLAIAVATEVRAAGVIAFSPWADLTCSGSTMTTNADRDIECTPESLRQMAQWYAGGHSPADRRLSPALDPSGIPPLIAFAGSDEVLLDDARRVTAETDATLVVAEQMQHIWPIWVGAFPEADAAMQRA
ncbi:MAG TPA: alpha/beta hydrolase fold domain-containing protein, partial [Candidatus Limnocylindrales bacterium]